DGDTVVADQAGGNVVLGRERIGGAKDYVGAAVAQADGEIGGLGGDVQAGGDANAAKRLVLDELFADDLQDFHRLICPLDALFAVIGQIEILNVAIHLRSSGRHNSPSGVSKSKTFLPPSSPRTPRKTRLPFYELRDR